MSDYFEYTDRSERTLENLLIWWGTREPFEHADDCEDPEQLHCCGGKNTKQYAGYGISAYTCSVGHPWGACVSDLTFVTPQGEKTLINMGDRIYYHGNYVFEHVPKAAVNDDSHT